MIPNKLKSNIQNCRLRYLFNNEESAVIGQTYDLNPYIDLNLIERNQRMNLVTSIENFNSYPSDISESKSYSVSEKDNSESRSMINIQSNEYENKSTSPFDSSKWKVVQSSFSSFRIIMDDQPLKDFLLNENNKGVPLIRSSILAGDNNIKSTLLTSINKEENPPRPFSSNIFGNNNHENPRNCTTPSRSNEKKNDLSPKQRNVTYDVTKLQGTKKFPKLFKKFKKNKNLSLSVRLAQNQTEKNKVEMNYTCIVS